MGKASADADLARAWVDHWRDYESIGTFPPNSTGQFVDLPGDSPEACWIMIVGILDLIDAKPDDPLFGVLAAGPLEDLLNEHGSEFIDRVEEKAATDPRFKQLLAGVWRNTIDPAVWVRVEACRGEPW